jgi:hypothetical protein
VSADPTGVSLSSIPRVHGCGAGFPRNMNYLRLLDEARGQLERGELLAAEDLVQRAREAWARSRFRAPLVERGVEPVLRRAGRWLGRRSDSPVLPVFGHRVARLEEDLAALAHLLRDEALDLARQDVQVQGLRECDLLERALRLDRQSRIFSLDRLQRWAVTRSYLQVGRRLARALRPALLPVDVAAEEDLAWLQEWANAWLASGATGDAEILEWVHRQAVAAASLATEGERAYWWWIAARAALHDPLSGPRALEATRRALETGLPSPERERALRALAALLVNERVLAGPGADVHVALRRHSHLAGTHEWPDPEVQALLQARRPNDAATTLIAAAWSDAGRELVLVSHRGAHCLDALTLRVADDPATGDPYSASSAEARGWVHRWLPERCVLVLPGAPPAAIEALLGERAHLRVDELADSLATGRRTGGVEAPAVPHPLWGQGPVPTPWSELVDRARETIPALRAILNDSPAFASGWGRANLQALAAHGLELCGALELAAWALLGEAPAHEDEVQTVSVGVELAWLPLQRRPWLAGPGELVAGGTQPASVEMGGPAAESGTDVWIGRRASPAELAAVAVAQRRAEVVTAGHPRARAIADRAAAIGDPRTVTVAPDRPRCAEPWLALLERWIRDAVADPRRQLDVLWLWRALSESPAGDPATRLGRRRSTDVLAEVDSATERDHRCSASCRLGRSGGCWSAQLAGRREHAVVWVVDLERSTDTLDAVDCVLLDDPRTWVVGCSSGVAESRLAHALGRVGRASRAWLWTDGGVLTDSILEAWRRRLPDPRPLHRRPAPALRPTPSVWLVPPGYRPADPLLAVEARRLVELRVDALRNSGQTFAWWTPASASSARGEKNILIGVAEDPVAEQVVCAELGDESSHSNLLLLLRAAAALSHANRRVVVLDSRLTHLLGHGGGVWSEGIDLGTLDPALVGALQSGARLLGARHSGAGSEWSHPLTAERLATAASLSEAETGGDRGRMAALARALREWGRGRALLLAAATDAERLLVVDTVRGLAEASADGGPLGTRCVIVVGAPAHWRAADSRSRILEHADDRTLGTVVLEVERGVVTRIDLAPHLLEDEGLLAWARRASQLAWVFVRSERDLDADPLGPDREDANAYERGHSRAQRIADALERAGSRVLVCVDSASTSANRISEVMSARSVLVEPAQLARTWTITCRAPEQLAISCPHCEASMSVRDLFTVCPVCARRAWSRAAGRLRIAHSFEEALVHRLQQQARSESTWALDNEGERAARLRVRLGLQPWGQDEAPLLRGTGSGPDSAPLAVVGVEELWDREGPVPAVQVLGRVRDAHRLTAILSRLDALGSEDRHIELFVEPVGLDSDTRGDGEGARWRWTAARTEVEFRLRTRLRGTVAAAGATVAGLGPFAMVPRLEDDTTEVLEALLDMRRPVAAIEAAASVALGEIERAGLGFGNSIAVPLPSALVRAHRGFLRWAASEGLLRREPAMHPHGPLQFATAIDLDELRWQRALRAADGDAVATLVDGREGTLTDSVRRSSSAVPSAGRRIGIAGSGKSAWLRTCVASARASGHRVLVVVPRTSARIRWARVDEHAVDVATAEEIALAFLRSARTDANDRTMLRLLPAAGRADGEEIRLKLMRESSRRYAAIAGSVPPIDAADLRRVVEDEPLLPWHTTETGLDRVLLVRCAEQARADAGWLSTRQLREECRRWLQRERSADAAWSARYPFVAIDDAHDVHPELLTFLREVFHGSVSWETSDPLLGNVPPGADAEQDEVNLQSRSMPREWVAAIEVLWRGAPALPGRPRTTRRGRDASRLRTVGVLTLEAVLDWIVAEIDPVRDPDRTAVAMAVEPDRHRLASALTASGHRVFLGDRLARWGASGPRELLACAHLIHATTTDDSIRERLLACVLGPVFEASPGSASAMLELFDTSMRAGDHVIAAADPESARVLVLASLASGLRSARTLQDLLEPLATRGVLDTLLSGDGSVGRLREVLELDASRPPEELLDTVPPDYVADPGGPNVALWLVGPDDLDPGTFDQVVHVCTGFEPPARHYRALTAATTRFTVLHSERDPLR